MDWTRRRLLRAIAPATVGAGLAGCNTTGNGDTPEPTDTTTTAPATTTAGTTGTDTATDGTDAASPTAEPNATTGTDTPSTADGQSAYTVEMLTELYFDPVGLFVEPGTTVAFENVSGAHSATAFHPAVETYSIVPERRVPAGAPPWNTTVIGEEGAVATVTFETPGTHDYFCIPHVISGGMVGRIVVGEPGGPATNSPNRYTSNYPLPDSERIVEEKRVPFEAVASQ